MLAKYYVSQNYLDRLNMKYSPYGYSLDYIREGYEKTLVVSFEGYEVYVIEEPCTINVLLAMSLMPWLEGATCTTQTYNW